MIFSSTLINLKTVRAVFILILSFVGPAFAQQNSAEFRSQEVSEEDGVPVLLKHLPDWRSVQGYALITDKRSDLLANTGDQPLISAIDFIPGTEAVSATYPAGKLVIVEHTSPQSASDADVRIRNVIELGNGGDNNIYRRIGNYSAFVLGTTDLNAANELLDQIKYEKTVQWLGEDPYLLQKLERYFATTGKEVALSTILFISTVLLTALVLGVISGIVYFRRRENLRANTTAFSDAGGLTRLNLDDLSEPL
ncbi:hypothetical protein [Leptolyngbya sp. 7M]|uniref:hypothetical protein n=1 Tax=Leptolyngbya sp. 7M TaxID=2812896 RepID=UPI001B8D1737|nr:hypothetical protein [Leptolyngbya sp. 7M]QYO66135.1 hypothetical protein JVX88_04870 [Leptolyngbya sp. 7M]